MSLVLQYKKFLGIDNMPNWFYKYLEVPSLVRLKKVGYFCGMDYASQDIYNFKEKVTRYDHSITTALITYKFTKDKKMTLAALFHDISTPCFSHVIDYMNKDYEKQEKTEEKTEEIIKNDLELIKLLKEDKVPVQNITNFKKYSIVDLDRPMLCADRIDGVILNGLFWVKNISLKDALNIIKSLDTFKNENNNLELGFNNKNIANLVIDKNKEINISCHSNYDNYMMELLAEITRRAITLKIISYNDLFTLDEETLFKKLKKSNDKTLSKNINLFMNILIKDIPDIKLSNIKNKDLNPIVCGKRLK